MTNATHFLTAFFIFLCGVSFPILADARYTSNPNYSYKIQSVDNHGGTWILTCFQPDGSFSWEVEIEGALTDPQVFLNGSLLWVGFTFNGAVRLNQRVSALHVDVAGFWAAFRMEDGRLVSVGKVTGTDGLEVMGFTAELEILHLFGFDGDRYFALPLMASFTSKYSQPMATSVKLTPSHTIGDPQPQTDNPTPPDPPDDP